MLDFVVILGVQEDFCVLSRDESRWLGRAGQGIVQGLKYSVFERGGLAMPGWSAIHPWVCAGSLRHRYTRWGGGGEADSPGLSQKFRMQVTQN